MANSEIECEVRVTRSELSMLAYACQCLLDERKRNNQPVFDVLTVKRRLVDALYRSAG